MMGRSKIAVLMDKAPLLFRIWYNTLFHNWQLIEVHITTVSISYDDTFRWKEVFQIITNAYSAQTTIIQMRYFKVEK